MLLYFRIYFFSLTNLKIDDAPKSKSRMEQKADSDTSGEIDFNELDEFFKLYVDVKKGKIYINVPVTGVFKRPLTEAEV
jgi:hypothetical protein